MGTMESGKTYIIYKATNKNNGKVYIGQTMFSLMRRSSQHRNCALNKLKKTKFYDAIRKYGFNSFLFEQIDSASSWNEASEKERKYIEFFDSYKNGYNSDLGGNTRPITNEERLRISKKLISHKVSEETRAKIRAARARQKPRTWNDEQRLEASIRAKQYFLTHPGTMKGKKFSNDHCKHISESLTGRKLSDEHRKKISKTQKGKSISEKTRKKISEANKGKKLSEEHKRKISETRKRLGLGNYGRWEKNNQIKNKGV